jgi:beta-lactamase regulating signal transducer with metallopeptidase domain
MDAYLNEVVRYLVAQSWQIALLTATVATTTFALRHRSAHVRYLLWLIVVAKCLVPPLYMVPLRVLPPLALDGIPDGLLQPDWPVARSGVSRAASPEKSTVQVRESTPAARKPQVDERRLSVSGWLGIIWVLGAGAYLTMNLLRALRGRHWLRNSRKPLGGDAQVDASDMLRAYGIRRLPRIWIVEGVGQPFVWGLLRGSIYVPPGFLTLASPAHRRDVLAHELSHIVRFDAAVNFLQVIAQAIFWFHPFVWWTNRKIRQEREKCCDEMVIARLHTPAKDYCNAVVETLATMKKSTRPVPSLAVAGPIRNVEERIKTMLRPGKRFYKRPSLLAAIVVRGYPYNASAPYMSWFLATISR